MTYCPECGSEVAPENTFCAYCGIALTPLVQPQPPAESEGLPPLVPPQASSSPAVSEPQTINRQPDIPESFSLKNSGEAELPHRTNLPETKLSTPAADAPISENAEPPALISSIETIAPEAAIATDEKILENLPLKTESAEDSLAGFENPKAIDKSAQNPPAKYSPPPAAANELQKGEEQFSLAKDAGSQNPVIHQSEENAPVNVSSNAKRFIESNNESKEKENQFSETFEENKNVSFDEKGESDLEATMPYAPPIFTGETPSLLKTTGDQPPEKVKKNAPQKNAASESEDFTSSAPREPIAKPEIPVGSTAYDSLEPTLVSVQIYNPNERPPEEIAREKEKMVEKALEKGNDAAASAPPQPVTKEARAFTSPNIGRTDTDGRNKAKLKPLDEGTVLNGRYEIVRKIGGGGMGAVYLASDRNLGGVLRAVKEMVQSYIEDAQQEKAVNDFKRESLLLTSLEHQSIPTIFDYFFDEQEGRFYLVMKYISGGDLAARLRSAPEGRIDEAIVTEWAIQIADVLDYLHNRQPPIVYRDLKPSNIMIDGNSGRVMLIDFGIARWVNKEEKGVTAVGTMGYAPPELFSGNVEPRSDIYSLGSTMFHLVTGADPQSNPLLIFDFHKHPRPRQINSQLSDQIEQILMRTVEYSSDKRFANAAELREALTEHLENLRNGKATFGAGDRSSATAAVAASAKAAAELVFCGFCGQKIFASDMFCPFCGAQQPLGGQAAPLSPNALPAAAVVPPSYIAPKQTARLMIIGTSELDAPVFNLEKDENLVGRRDPMSNIFPEVDLSKFDPQTKISRRHARIWRQSGAYMLEDLGSSNGTVLISQSSEPVRLPKNQPRILVTGDKIRVGDTVLHFVVN